jgi:HAD superfamily hydrolase (TIGR01509 family)
MRYPVLMFDFGNVVGFYDHSLTQNRFATRLGITAEQLEARIVGLGIPELALRFELGKIEPEEFARTVMGLAGLRMSFEEFEQAWADIFTPNEPVARLITTLKQQGYTLALGSNTNILHARFYRRQFHDVLDYFDYFIFSCDVGEMKPDLAFFTACIGAVAAPSGSCVFIDDAMANVQGARASGMVGLHYRDTPTLIAELRSLGIEIPNDQA